MSNLLKNNPDRIVAFGFPAIGRGAGQIVPVLPPEELAPEPEAAPPEVSLEEIYRRKLLELERQSQEIERDAYSKGFAQGEKDGLDYGQKSVQVVSSQIERIAQSMKALPAKVFEDYREWLIRTSIGIARQIVGREIQTTPEIVADLVRDLIGQAEQHSTLTVHLNPNDLELLEKKTAVVPLADGPQFVLKADKDVERGGCRIESAIQLIDGSIVAMFKKMEKELLEKSRSQDLSPDAVAPGEPQSGEIEG
ncbi:MAG: FliH/SctL family protein [Syntrophobacteraceae bacterium]|nr:FliH/SctL family protein [Syntrophobacteraceae bacterium]